MILIPKTKDQRPINRVASIVCLCIMCFERQCCLSTLLCFSFATPLLYVSPTSWGTSPWNCVSSFVSVLSPRTAQCGCSAVLMAKFTTMSFSTTSVSIAYERCLVEYASHPATCKFGLSPSAPWQCFTRHWTFRICWCSPSAMLYYVDVAPLQCSILVQWPATACTVFVFLRRKETFSEHQPYEYDKAMNVPCYLLWSCFVFLFLQKKRPCVVSFDKTRFFVGGCGFRTSQASCLAVAANGMCAWSNVTSTCAVAEIIRTDMLNWIRPLCEEGVFLHWGSVQVAGGRGCEVVCLHKRICKGCFDWEGGGGGDRFTVRS